MTIGKRHILTFLIMMWVITPMSNTAYADTQETTVYYCTGPNSKRYHKHKSCKGLKKCSGKIIKCTKLDAIHKGFTPCKYCYKK